MTRSRSERTWLVLGLAVLLFVGLVPHAVAQEGQEGSEAEQTEGEPAAEGEETEEEFADIIVVTGTRAQPRSVVETMVPIDVIPVEDFTNQGDNDVSTLLRNLAPSFNVNMQPISDAATVSRPANLRNLAPDHTLVLVNGKRRHRAAVIYWLGNGVADGAQGPDISAIPGLALRQVEVLRDGASAQYGSDAIAGVMNFLLKDSASGGSVEIKYGQYAESDGDAASVAANFGFPLGNDGFFNLTFEAAESDPTDRSQQRPDAAGLIAAGNTSVLNPAQVWGSPEISDDYKIWANFGSLVGATNQFYGHANYVSKTVTGGFFFRNPNTRSAVFSGDSGETLLIGNLSGAGTCPVVNITNNVPDPTALAQVFADPNCFSFQELFPGGFTPQFGGDVVDNSIVLGLRGHTAAGLTWDASVSQGSNEADFFISNTVNASLGPDTPTTFDPGLYKQEELNFNFDIAYPLNDRTNLAAGVEWREEDFEIGLGQRESWLIGPLAPQGFSAASNGFPGFSPVAAGNWSRSNWALYGDVERNSGDGKWAFGVAARFEDFEDFGTTTNGKLSGRYKVSDKVQLRASASTGFRAPTPGQSNAFNVSTEFDLVLQELVNNGNVPPTSRAAQLKGGQVLQPEESTSLAAGIVFDNGPFTLTVDLFSIELDDRVTQSQLFSLTDAEVELLLSEGITSAANLQNFRFFTNDFDTETQGVDVVATWTPPALGGDTTFSLLFNTTDTEVTRFNPETLDATRIRELQEALPETRWLLTATHKWENGMRLLGRVSSYDDWFDSEDDEVYSGKSLVDLEFGFPVADSTEIVVGSTNVLDEFPDAARNGGPPVGRAFSQYSPFGFNGAYYYARLKFDFDTNWGN